MPEGRRAKRVVTAEQKYDLWQRMLTGQLTTVAAAAEAGVDPHDDYDVAQGGGDGAIAALQSRSGRPKQNRAELTELAQLRAEVARLSSASRQPRVSVATSSPPA
ncbi:MAG: hypothetical protein M3256_15840, partial [Actinomycetota bacterium]|nr:hypothetical protein [Actinomycetota bacterium]